MALTVNSPSIPFQDAAGNLSVERGDRRRLIPRDRWQACAQHAATEKWFVGATLLGLRVGYRLDPHAEHFATVQNVLEERYANYGLFSDPTGVAAQGIPAGAESNDPGVDNRFQRPGMPRAFFGGLKISFWRRQARLGRRD